MLALKHGIEHSLYHSSNIAKIYSVIGRKRQSDILKKVIDRNFSEKETWNEVILYLDKELRLTEQLLMVNVQVAKSDGNDRRRADESHHSQNDPPLDDVRKCTICNKTDHEQTVTSRGKRVVNYFSCEKFVNMSAKKMFETLKIFLI